MDINGVITLRVKALRRKSTVSAPQIQAEEAQLVKHRKMHAGILRPLSPLHIHAVL